MLYLVTFGFALMSWLAYGVSRLILSFLQPLGLSQADAVALSFLAGMAMFVGLVISTLDTIRENKARRLS